MARCERDRPRWLFAYGSLIWKPEPDFGGSSVACLRGYRRRFWQGSPDHRGTPDAPGRVVTLVPEAGAICWGAAYDISSVDLARLDRREAGGYRRVEVDLETRAAERLRALAYVGDADNPWYLGPASDRAIADQVLSSEGPSGANRDYVLRLAKALCELGIDDDHVSAVAALVRP